MFMKKGLLKTLKSRLSGNVVSYLFNAFNNVYNFYKKKERKKDMLGIVSRFF